MARKAEQAEYITLTDSEKELLDYSLEGDWFFHEAWNRYGEDWPGYVPDNINVAMGYFFGIMLLPHQLRAYYCPITDIMIHGGRYSAKTVGCGLSTAMYIATHPGINWLHVSPSVDQAILSYKKILEWGDAKKFTKTFIRHRREAPAPTLFFKKWDRFDPGSEAQFRSIGSNPMELLRSFEAGWLTGDEAYRTQTSDGPYRVMAGMARGPNAYMLNKHPDLKKEYDNLAFSVGLEMDPEKRKKMQIEVDAFAEKHGLSKDIRFMLYGNVGPYTWEWSRFIWGQRNPGKRWSVTWTSDDNPYCTEAQRDFLKQQYKDDLDGLRVEMKATRPLAVGDIFTGMHMLSFLNGDLDAAAVEATDPENPIRGWKWSVHEDYGVTHYAKPKEGGAVYAAGGDPGTGRVPHRNKWVNIVARIDKRPFEISYVHTGNVTVAGQGSIQPWIEDCQQILRLYPMPEGHFAAEAGGTQKDVHEVVWPDNLRIAPLNMQTLKPKLIMQAQLMFRRQMWTSPNIGLLEQELLGYQLQDKKLAQDFVMAFLALVYVTWPYVADEFELEDGPSEEEDYWESFTIQRETRMAGREMRVR